MNIGRFLLLLLELVIYVTAIAYVIVIYLLIKHRNNSARKLNSSFFRLCIILGFEDILLLIATGLHLKLPAWFHPGFGLYLVDSGYDVVMILTTTNIYMLM